MQNPFADDHQQDSEQQQIRFSRDTEALRAAGLIRVQGLIPISLNERIKSFAKKRSMKADELVGNLIEEGAKDLTRLEAQEHAKQLRTMFGDNWLEVMRQAAK